MSLTLKLAYFNRFAFYTIKFFFININFTCIIKCVEGFYKRTVLNFALLHLPSMYCKIRMFNEFFYRHYKHNRT